MIWLVHQLSKLFSLEDALNRLILLRLTFRILNLCTKSTVVTKMSWISFAGISFLITDLSRMAPKADQELW